MRFTVGGGAWRGRTGLAVAACLAGCLWLSCDDPAGPAGGLTATSSAEGEPQHTHAATVPYDDIDAPPGGGVAYTTTTSAGHNHSVALSADQLVSLQQVGALVWVGTAGGTGDHQHTFTFIR